MHLNRWQTLALILLILFWSLAGCQKTNLLTEEQWVQRYLDYADVRYARQVALAVSKFGSNPMGFRTAGTQAEYQAADYLYQQMKSIGLQEVIKEAFPVEKWEFKRASLAVIVPLGANDTIEMSAYPTKELPPDGIKAELVYVSRGTMNDYFGREVNGRIVLLDVDMRKDWWITYPAMQALHRGAVAVISVSSGGYAMVNDEALNSQDFSGPLEIPTFNISRKDAQSLKDLLQVGMVTVQITAQNLVEPGGQSYNVAGKIIGRYPDEIILIGGHYDAFFTGYQDNASAAGLTLAIARDFLVAGYQPEHTLVFILHGAGEYGATDTRYDHSIGAWNQVSRLHPEWIGKALAYINFEMVAYAHNAMAEVVATPELVTFLEEFGQTAPRSQQLYPQGIVINTPITTASDDFPYSIAGIPAMGNGYTNSPFLVKFEHSQFDTVDTYNELALDDHLRFFGSLVITLDQKVSAPMDFSVQARRMAGLLNPAVFTLAGVDPQPLLNEIAAFDTIASQKYNQIHEANRLYAALIEAQVSSRKDYSPYLEELRISGRTADTSLLAAYRIVQSQLVRLDWRNEPIYGFEQPQRNLFFLSDAIAKLQSGQSQEVLINILWQIEDEAYSYSFDKEVIQRFTNQVLTQSPDRLFWGAGKIVGHVDLYDVIQAIKAKNAAGELDFSVEIGVIQQVMAGQAELLNNLVAEEINILRDAQTQLASIDLMDGIAKAKLALGEK